MLQWSTSACVTEPCITAGLTNEELIQFTGTPLELPNISCHSQAVEREVKLSSSPWNRNHDQQGFAFNVASARKAIPQEQIAIKLFKEKNKKQKSHTKNKKGQIGVTSKLCFGPEYGGGGGV